MWSFAEKTDGKFSEQLGACSEYSHPVSFFTRLVCIPAFCIFLLSGRERVCAKMVLEGIEGEVTTNELASFIEVIHSLPPPPSNNIGNTMVYESVGGARLHGLQTFYSFTKDRRALDKAITWSDAFLRARNDPATGRVVWTSKRELCWPNKAPNDGQALYSGTENGDVIEHIVNTAKLILEEPGLWAQTAPRDQYGFGETYLDRAKTYVRECQRSAETTIVPWYVRETKAGYRLIHPESRDYWKSCVSKGPVPWNQQQMIVGGLLRLAQCHRLLNDGDTNIVVYEKITEDAADWFFSSAMLVSAKGRNCYDWAYELTSDIVAEPEDIGHTFYDVYVMRAYSANLGPTRTNMQRLINTARFVMNVGTNRFSGLVNGMSTSNRPERKYLNYEWIEMSVLDHHLYTLLGNAVLASRQYADDIPVQAAVLYAKHYWATAPASLKTEEVLEETNGVPPVPRVPLIPPAAILALVWGGSELARSRLKAAQAKAQTRPRSLPGTVITAVAMALGFVTAHKLYEYRLPRPEISLGFAYCLFAGGLALRWYSVMNARPVLPTSIPHPTADRLIAANHAGSLLVLLGLSLSFQNWASLLIVFVPAGAVMLRRIRIIP